MELFHANKQWSTRPEDERFTSVQSLHAACKAYALRAHEQADVPLSTLRAAVSESGEDVVLVGRKEIPSRLTHWAFGQLAARVQAPASYLRSLPAELAVSNLNHGLKLRVQDEPDQTVNILTHHNGGCLVRAMTSDRYERIWNHEITDRLLDLEAKGWRPATPDIRVKEDGRLPLYASDHDMFAFLSHRDRVIKEPGNGAGLQRGVIVSNSEVGAGKLLLLRFLYRGMCGNHIIWGAEDVLELSCRHVGRIRERMSQWGIAIARYMDSSASQDEAKIAESQTRQIAATREGVLDLLFGKRSLALSRKVLAAGYDAVNPDEDGDPRTVWGIVQGLTRHSQTIAFADERTAIDTAAGKILDIF